MSEVINSMSDFWPLLMEIHDLMWQARRAYFGSPPPVQELLAEFGVRPEAHVGQFIYCLQNYNPQALSAEHFMVRNCYDKAESLKEQFAELAADGLLSENDDSSYRVSEKGLDFYRRVAEIMNPRWNIATLADEEMERLLAMLGEVHEVMRNTPEPPAHWATTTRARMGLRQPNDSHLGKLYDLIYDLWAYRDDAHLAAWRPNHAVEPRTWELFTYMWNGKARSVAKAAELLQKEFGRGYTVREYGASLEDLLAWAWLEPAADADHFQLTAAGQQIRDEAERLTDDYFYIPWAILDEGETAELRDLLIRLRDKLKQIGEG
jgi:hypothetical protein